ncbi:MAG: type III-B CRISPR module RAMP protein Cmr1 [Chloroflexota bacterium]|nr:type III-B CRISPR module RAMP protein Cmr1 [Chloroflexota bacterium]
MSEPLTITLRTLTPLWTGGVDGKCDRLHVTGIIGSLRWWYEALVRAGGYACDPASDNKCRYDSKDPQPPEKQLCPACYVFGATGWRRRFRLKVVEDATEPAWNPSTGALNIRPPDRSRGWYLPPGRVGEITLRLDGDNETLQKLAALFLFLEQWGSLGAKPQLGYGAFEITNREKVTDRTSGWGVWPSQDDKDPHVSLPDLRRFHFFRYTFTPARRDWWLRLADIQQLLGKHKEIGVLNTLYQRRMVPTTPLLKNIWRYREWHGSRPVSRWIFGVSTVRKQAGRTVIHRVRSKVAVTWAYALDDMRWSMHGWLWLPENDDSGRLPGDELKRLAEMVLRRETFTALCGAVREETYQLKHGMEVLYD